MNNPIHDIDDEYIEEIIQDAYKRCAESQGLVRVEPGWTEETGVFNVIKHLIEPSCVYRWDDSETGVEAEVELECHELNDSFEGLPSFARFKGLGADHAIHLLGILPGHALSDRQNGAPSLLEMLAACARHPNHVELFGYYVGPDRNDERVTIEGILYSRYRDLEITRFHDENCECEKLWDAIIADFEWNYDEITTPDELTTVEDSSLGGSAWRMWWD